MQARERLYLTAEKDRLVRHGDRDAAFLYAAVGDEIPESAVARFGIVDGRLKRKAKPAAAGKPEKPEVPHTPKPESPAPTKPEAPARTKTATRQKGAARAG